MLISLLIVLLIFALVCWLISFIPLPATTFPIRNILYIIAIIIFIIYLLRFIRL